MSFIVDVMNGIIKSKKNAAQTYKRWKIRVTFVSSVDETYVRRIEGITSTEKR